MSIKRIDRTKELMMDLEKSASAGVKEAAIMLKVIAREMVNRKYTGKLRKSRTGAEIASAEAKRRENARKYFLSLPAKKRPQARQATMSPLAAAVQRARARTAGGV